MEWADELAARHVTAAGSPPSGLTGSAQLTYTAATARLSWYFTSPGDYDQNGEVNIGDLTPLAVHYLEVSPGGAGTPFVPKSNSYFTTLPSGSTLALASHTTCAAVPIGAGAARVASGDWFCGMTSTTAGLSVLAAPSALPA